MRLPLRRIVLGFAVGASAGWVAGLLRRPKDAPPGTGADAAEHMPVEEFGDLVEENVLEGADEIAQEPTAPVEAAAGAGAATGARERREDGDLGELGDRPPPRKALPETVTPPPGTETLVGETGGASGGSEPAKPAKPARRRTAKGAARVKAVAEPASEEVRAGRAQVTEHLAGLDEAVAPPPPALDPQARRRRKRTD